jgi:DNA topoisomerase-2
MYIIIIKMSAANKSKSSSKKIIEISDIEIESESDDESEIIKPQVPIRTKELEVKCLDLHNQILLRPDTYIGSIKRIKSSDKVWVVKDKKFIQSNPTSSEGLLRTFVEILSNAIDNIWRSKEFGIVCKTIKINIDHKTGLISVFNDGKSIPLDFNKTENKYNIELIFFRLLTSTNYDDNEKRKTSGRNGYGAKLTSIFSTSSNIEIYNPKDKKIYKQSSSNNMKNISSPVITDCFTTFPDLGKGSGYTKISWTSDLFRFDKMTCYDDDILSLYEKYIYDTAMIASKYNVKVYLNDELIPINSLKDYALLHCKDGESEDIHSFSSTDSNVVIIPFHEHVCVSFVNGINTTENGIHADSWIEGIFRPIVDKINGVKKTDSKVKTKAEKDKEKKKKEKDKKDSYKINIGDVKNNFAIFIDCELNNPEFRGQNKTKLSAPNVEVKIKKTDIPKIMKWSVIDKIKQMIELKEMSNLKIKKRCFTRIENLDDANFAKKKTAKRKDCILCITEGLSAKTYVVQGMKYGLLSRTGTSVSGRDYIGILPIRGKFINPRGKSIKMISKNKEALSIIQSLGLEPNVDYTVEENLENLRYGRIAIFTDNDYDGYHINALIYNFLNTLYPSILHVPSFFCFVRTPIMKMNHQGEKLVFYYLSQAHKFIIDKNVQKKSIKYYKGLGTSNSKDVKEDFGKRIVDLVSTDDTDTLIDNIFNGKKSDYRKEWLTSYNPSNTIIIEGEDGETEELKIPTFINEQFILYSIDHCKRSIPNLYDGLKESQRKILYAVFLRKLKYSGKSLKVAQLSGYVAEHTNYHHGEDNLLDTIRGMATRYVGSNNMPFFFNDGQFGSRLENSNDGASGRYIFTKQESYIRSVFPEEDDNYLENIEDDGDIVEPKYYVPVIPMILVNGCIGIGTGFSTSIPSYNPLVLIEWIKVWIKTEGRVTEDLGDGIVASEGPDLIPWYRNFKGEIKLIDNKVITHGIVTNLGKGKYRVSELPIGRKNWSIKKFKEKLEDLLEKKNIKDFTDNSTEAIVDFTITEDQDCMNINLETLGLVDIIHTSNMVLFQDEFKLKKYETVEEIMNEFCIRRLSLYVTRREGDIKKLEEILKYTNNKIRFINEVNLSDTDKNKLVIKNREDEDLYSEMDKRKYDRKVNKGGGKNIKKEKNEEDDGEEDNEEEEEKVGTFNYLLDMKMRGATKKKMDLLIKEGEKLEKDIDTLRRKKPEDLWEEDLVIVEKKYNEWLFNEDKVGDEKSKSKKKSKKNSKDEKEGDEE